MDTHEALAHVESVRLRTREPFRALWYPVLLFGVLALGSAVLNELAPSATSLYWLIGGIAAWVAITRYYTTRATRAGIGRPVHQTRANLGWAGLWFAIFVVATVGATIDRPWIGIVGITGLVGVAYILLARQAGNTVVAVAGLAIVTSGIAIAALGGSHEYTLTSLAMGVILSLSGLYLHALQQSDE